MEPRRHALVAKLFEEVSQVPPDQREAFLDERCKGDSELRKEVAALLRHDVTRSRIEDPFGLLQEQTWKRNAQTSPDTPITVSRSSEYRLVSSLGSGGMGVVFEAKQLWPIERTVALKVIKAGSWGPEAVQRFELERQMLGLMDHPNVAKVFDAGLTDAGEPFFVMEYVQGKAITEYADEHHLSTLERLELFRKVCAGVQHAHQMAIIHRDLKPSNVLVTEMDGTPIPKIIDFGVAKAVSERPFAHPTLTKPGIMIGTPEYMSPEQAAHQPPGIDTRSDVYSLGVMLYELLVGSRPFAARVHEDDYDAIRRRILEDEPVRPSMKLETLGEVSAVVAGKRGVDPRTLRRQLRGDLDWIVMKAMEKDRDRRYASPTDLSADLGRHLANEPVSAGPPSARYRAAKFVRRHRLGVGMAAAAVGILLVFGITMTVVAGRIATERDRARQAGADLEAVVDFQSGMLSRVDPAAVGRHLVDEMLTQAGESYRSHGVAEEEIATRNARLRASLSGINSTDLALSILNRDILAPADSTIGERFGDQPGIESRLRTTLGMTYMDLGILGAAEGQFLRALERREHIYGSEDSLAVVCRFHLACYYERMGRFGESEDLFEEVLEKRNRLWGPNDPETMNAAGALALCYADQSKVDIAESLYVETLARERSVLGDDHIYTVSSVLNLGFMHLNQGNYTAAEPYLLEAVQRNERTFGEDHPRTFQARNLLAGLYKGTGRFQEAESLYVDNLESRTRMFGRDHINTVVSEGNLGFLYVAAGRYAEAESLLTDCLPRAVRALGEFHKNVRIGKIYLGDAFLQEEKFTQAESVYVDILKKDAGPHGDGSPRVDVLYRLASLNALWGKQGDAVTWIERAIDAGFSDPDSLARDSAFTSLHGDPRFQALVSRSGQVR